MELSFKTWLEVGQTGGVGGGLTPEVEPPSGGAPGALADFHSSNPRNPHSQLPPINKDVDSDKQRWKKRIATGKGVKNPLKSPVVMGDIGYI